MCLAFRVGFEQYVRKWDDENYSAILMSCLACLVRILICTAFNTERVWLRLASPRTISCLDLPL